MAPPVARAKELNASGSVRSKSKAPTTAKKPSSTGSTANTSTNASAAKLDPTRRVVFRPVLDNPLNIDWPPLPATVRGQLLDLLLAALTSKLPTDELSIFEWRTAEHARKRSKNPTSQKAKRESKKSGGVAEASSTTSTSGQPAKRAGDGVVDSEEGSARKKARIENRSAVTSARPNDGSAATATPATTAPRSAKYDLTTPAHVLTLRSARTVTVPDFVDRPLITKSLPPPLPRPHLLDYLSVGINDVTRAIESQVRWGRWELGDLSAGPRLKLAGSAAAKGAGEAMCTVKDSRPASANRRKMRRPAHRVDPSEDIRIDSSLSESQKALVASAYRFLVDGASDDRSWPPYFRDFGEDPNIKITRILANSHALRIKTSTKVAKDWCENGTREAIGSSRKASKAKSCEVEALSAEDDDWHPLIDLIFVCKPDINPPSLVAHLPTMCAAANGVQRAVVERRAKLAAKTESEDRMEDNGEILVPAPTLEKEGARQIYLVPLDIGAEHKLAEALGLRRIAAIGISSSNPAFASLLAFVKQSVSPLFAPWLNPLPTPSIDPSTTYIPTHIKHLRTTVPLNPKAAHMKKKEEKKKAKEEKKKKMSGKHTMAKEGAGIYVANDDMDY